MNERVAQIRASAALMGALAERMLRLANATETGDVSEVATAARETMTLLGAMVQAMAVFDGEAPMFDLPAAPVPSDAALREAARVYVSALSGAHAAFFLKKLGRAAEAYMKDAGA